MPLRTHEVRPPTLPCSPHQRPVVPVRNLRAVPVQRPNDQLRVRVVQLVEGNLEVNVEMAEVEVIAGISDAVPPCTFGHRILTARIVDRRRDGLFAVAFPWHEPRSNTSLDTPLLVTEAPQSL
jgi:hypothetical protein